MKKYKKENVMISKELEKQNFLTWRRYATPEEIEKAKGINKMAFKRLSNKYADEIEQMNKAKSQFKFIPQHCVA